MGPGTPGLGIASLFYVGAALFAVVRELKLTMQGRSSKERWSVVRLQATLALLVIASVVTLYIGLALLIEHGYLPGLSRQGPALLRRFPNYLWALFALLFVLGTSAAYARWVRWTRPTETREEVADAHRSSVEGGAMLPPRPTQKARASEVPRPSWWLASDGYWYPPELNPLVVARFFSSDDIRARAYASRFAKPGWWRDSSGLWYPPELNAESWARYLASA